MKPFPRKIRRIPLPKEPISRRLSRKQIAYYKRMGFKVLRHGILAGLILFNPKTGKQVLLVEERVRVPEAVIKKLLLPDDKAS